MGPMRAFRGCSGHGEQQLRWSCGRDDDRSSNHASGLGSYHHLYDRKLLLPRGRHHHLSGTGCHDYTNQLQLEPGARRLYLHHGVVYLFPAVSEPFGRQRFDHADHPHVLDATELTMRCLPRYACEDRGASSAEFALVSIPFIALVLAIIGGAMMFYANQSLQYATEAAARYYSVQTANTGAAPSATAVQTYATK